MKLPTVTIITKNGPVVINKDDFNAETHSLFTESSEPESKKPVIQPRKDKRNGSR